MQMRIGLQAEPHGGAMGRARRWLAGRLCAVLYLVMAVTLGGAGSASANSDWGHWGHRGHWRNDLVSIGDLEDGGSLTSGNGLLTFSDFEFTAVGFSDPLLDHFFVQPRDQGLQLLMGLRDPFGSLEMRYTVTAAEGFAIDEASIPLLLLLKAGSDPLLEVDWHASNGASLYGSTGDHENFPWPGVSTSFDAVTGLMVEQTITLGDGRGSHRFDGHGSGARGFFGRHGSEPYDFFHKHGRHGIGRSGIAKVANDFHVTELPEPGSGLLLVLGVGAAFAAHRGARRS